MFGPLYPILHRMSCGKASEASSELGVSNATLFIYRRTSITGLAPGCSAEHERNEGAGQGPAGGEARKMRRVVHRAKLCRVLGS